MFDLTGKKAIVTGGAGDLGFAMAQALAEQGASLAIWDRSDQTEAAARRLSRPGMTAGAFHVDLAEREQIASCFDETVKALGGLDILINCAGINIRHPSEAFPPEDWDSVLNINLSATFFLCQKAASVMLGQGRGSIINIASMNSFIGGMSNVAYAASKSGVAGLTKTLSNEWAGRGVRVNAIAPGYMDTQMNAYYRQTGDGDRLKAIITPRIPVGRWGVPDDLKGAAVFLASDDSAFVSGLILAVDGGFLAR